MDFNSRGAAWLKSIADHLSETERNSSDAERDSKEVKLFAFLKAQLASGKPHAYAGLVIDVRNFGCFVDVPELGLSGLVHLSSIEDDFFDFDPNRNHLIGRRSRRVIKLGDRVEVQVAKVDTFKKLVDFRLSKTSQARPVSARPAPRAPGPSRHPQRANRRSFGHRPPGRSRRPGRR